MNLLRSIFSSVFILLGLTSLGVWAAPITTEKGDKVSNEPKRPKGQPVCGGTGGEP